MNTTASRLQEVARGLFARQGYAGTSVRQITARAGANLGAVTYHFGSKERLYHTVLRGLTAPLLQRLAEAAAAPGSALDRIGATVRAVLEHFGSHPDIPRIMAHELALQGPFPAPVREVQTRARDHLLGLIEAGQREGSIRPGDPLLLTLSVIAQPIYFALASRMLRQLAGFSLEDPAARQRIIAHAILFVRRGLAPGAESAS